MTEARTALAAFDGLGGLERWIAAQSWEATPDGWTMAGEFQGWTVARELQGWLFRVAAR